MAGEAAVERLAGVRCFLLDMDGTIYLGNRLLPGASALLERLQERGPEYLILTNNSSRSKHLYARKLHGLGLGVPAERILTSGEATAIYLNMLKPGARVYLVGTPALAEEFASSGFNLVQDVPDFAVLGFDTTLTYEKLWRLCDFVRAGVPYVATHPDINCPLEGGFMPDIGAMIAFVEASTGRRPTIIGKPNRPIIEAVTARTGIPAAQMCMVGDRLYTDIAMGQAGIMTVLVLSGESRRDDIPASPFKPDLVVENLAVLLALLPE
ncbi:MAG: HAD-IIA family hydrolase [Anaerolineae bacterium]